MERKRGRESVVVVVGVVIGSMAAAAAAAGRAALVSTSESGAHCGALVPSVRAHSASARPGPSHSQFSQSVQPRLIALSSFLGVDVDRSVLRSSNVSSVTLRYPFVSNE